MRQSTSTCLALFALIASSAIAQTLEASSPSEFEIAMPLQAVKKIDMAKYKYLGINMSNGDVTEYSHIKSGTKWNPRAGRVWKRYFKTSGAKLSQELNLLMKQRATVSLNGTKYRWKTMCVNGKHPCRGLMVNTPYLKSARRRSTLRRMKNVAVTKVRELLLELKAEYEKAE